MQLQQHNTMNDESNIISVVSKFNDLTFKLNHDHEDYSIIVTASLDMACFAIIGNAMLITRL